MDTVNHCKVTMFFKSGDFDDVTRSRNKKIPTRSAESTWKTEPPFWWDSFTFKDQGRTTITYVTTNRRQVDITEIAMALPEFQCGEGAPMKAEWLWIEHSLTTLESLCYPLWALRLPQTSSLLLPEQPSLVRCNQSLPTRLDGQCKHGTSIKGNFMLDRVSCREILTSKIKLCNQYYTETLLTYTSNLDLLDHLLKLRSWKRTEKLNSADDGRKTEGYQIFSTWKYKFIPGGGQTGVSSTMRLLVWSRGCKRIKRRLLLGCGSVQVSRSKNLFPQSLVNHIIFYKIIPLSEHLSNWKVGNLHKFSEQIYEHYPRVSLKILKWWTLLFES